MGRKLEYTAKEVAEALRAAKGMVYVAADRLGCSYRTVYNYIDRFKTVADEIEHQEGFITDTAEIKLVQAIHNGEAWAIKYRLATKGRNRGYVERQEVTGKDGGAIAVEITKGYVSVTPDDWDEPEG